MLYSARSQGIRLPKLETVIRGGGYGTLELVWGRSSLPLAEPPVTGRWVNVHRELWIVRNQDDHTITWNLQWGFMSFTFNPEYMMTKIRPATEDEIRELRGAIIRTDDQRVLRFALRYAEQIGIEYARA